MGAHWARGVAALLLVAGAGALGTTALLAGPAVADPVTGPTTSSCGPPSLKPCPPKVTVSPMSSETSGTITIDWAASLPSDTVDPEVPTLMWTPQASGAPADPATIPTLAPQPLGPCQGGKLGALTCTYSWPTTLLDNGYVLNGTYTLVAVAKECPLVTILPSQCSDDASLSQPIGIQNPAVAPTGVKAQVVPGSNPQTVQITWSPNPEPDVVGYEVYSGTSTTPFCSANTSASNPESYSCEATPTKNGAYNFHVVAYRYGASFSDKVAQQIAGAASATTPNVTIAGITGPVTTLAGSSTLGGIATTKPGSTRKGATPATTGHTFGTIVIAPTIQSTTTTTLGGSYNPVLPYGSVPSSTSTTGDPAAISVPTHHGGGSLRTIAAIGAGLLIAVIALHGVWLRSEVRRGDQLEPLEPESVVRR